MSIEHEDRTDFNQNEALNLRLQQLGADPSTAVEGQIWYRSDTHRPSVETDTGDEPLAYLSDVISGTTNPERSTGLLTWTGVKLVKVDATHVGVGALTGVIVDTTGAITDVTYAGTASVLDAFVGTTFNTYFTIDSTATLIQRSTHPTPQQAREEIFLGYSVHAPVGTITTVTATPDISFNTMSQVRDVINDGMGIVNKGIRPQANGANLQLNMLGGYLFSMGINFVNNALDPARIQFTALTPATFQYRTQTGAATGNLTSMEVGYYDVAGTRTAIGSSKYSTQRVYVSPAGLVRLQYGQVTYNSMASALAALSSESFVTYPAFQQNLVLVGSITVSSNATVLNDLSHAVFTPASIFGELVVGGGGTSTTTLQGAYSNSTEPEITLDSTRGAVSIKSYSGGDATNSLEILEDGGTTTASITGAGKLTASSANITGLTASEIVATDASKNLQTLAVATYPSLAELAYVKGVTSAIQTQLNGKAFQASATVTISGGRIPLIYPATGISVVSMLWSDTNTFSYMTISGNPLGYLGVETSDTTLTGIIGDAPLNAPPNNSISALTPHTGTALVTVLSSEFQGIKTSAPTTGTSRTATIKHLTTTTDLALKANIAGQLFTGKVSTPVSTAARAGLNVGAFGVVPSSPVDGDIYKSAADTLVSRMSTNTRTIPFLEKAQTFSGIQTFSASPVISSTTTANTAGILYRTANYGLTNYELALRQFSTVIFRGGTGSTKVATNLLESALTATGVFGASNAIPANLMQTGVTLKVRIAVNHTVGVTGTTLSLRLYIAGVEVSRYGKSSSSTSTSFIEFFLYCASSGTSGVIIPGGFADPYFAYAAFPSFTMNTTVSNTLQVTAAWNVVNTSSVTNYIATIEAV